MLAGVILPYRVILQDAVKPLEVRRLMVKLYRECGSISQVAREFHTTRQRPWIPTAIQGFRPAKCRLIYNESLTLELAVKKGAGQKAWGLRISYLGTLKLCKNFQMNPESTLAPSSETKYWIWSYLPYYSGLKPPVPIVY